MNFVCFNTKQQSRNKEPNMAATTIAPVAPKISPTATDKSLPYRTGKVDEHDRTYATRLSSVFSKLPDDVRTGFNGHTGNLMAETHINRYYLLEAIKEYTKIHGVPNTNWWNSFREEAYNCRPYQGW